MTYLLQALQARAGEFISLRRDIHRHPELAFEEHRTAALVADKLEGWGYAVERGIGGTGVVGTLVRGRGTRRLGLRADMDALPIAEASGAEWSSRKAGVMHACGHDGHTAMLLAAARHLAEQGSFDGTLHLIFQPAEEGGGGALRMMADGLFERFPCDAVFAMHNMPGTEQGRFVLREGAAMASSDYATVTLTGFGGHGAMPHRAADPIVAAASIVMALQTVVSRNIDPLQAAVVTVGALHAGKANNVIPASATLELSVRALDREVRATIERRVKALVAAQAESFGVTAQVDWKPGYAVLVNTPAETAFAREVALELVGEAQVTLQGPPLTGSEDFAFMLERVPGSYLLIGNGTGEGAGEGGCMVHNPGYDFNDANIGLGSAYWVLLAERFLAAKGPATAA
ncbi:MAG TPA: M20 aminoacylase family protein [Piscinibacter sp.]|uniref:M20 aminoacylase family protein n=1 Tax=Piscinibacter sp. TaxID=1903157 RepID=UPI001B6D1FBD|nr:M20 aminoacylase family protein [Piscinibacter sp.]MBK7532495.1 amidohydrolase [Piscinibacter sp.]MBP6542597.1 amidohydrolase [Piscinibacter sp.]HOY33755.1 M20 aminoacylase family protein [Piscinibacter sp.]HPG77105.1 M20 aminoacylase family protein [Piscinibacter sp.]HPM64680.1 M20 aminoacylase family protein [Piscinibacter sp.]